MKPVFLALFIILMPSLLLAHPGKTDKRGGHRCWKNCGEWELARKEYHLHDKEGKTIRIDRGSEPVLQPEPKTVPTPEKYFLQEESSETSETIVRAIEDEKKPVPGERPIVTEKHETVTVYHETILPFYTILLGLLAFLLLILLVFVRNRKEKD